MQLGTAVRQLFGVFNRGMGALMKAPVIGPLIGRQLIEMTYVGRRSGRTVTLPVGYRRSGDVITIGVEFPDAKNWWRNFQDDGAPVTLRLPDGVRTGHGTAAREKRRVKVTIQLGPSPAPAADPGTSAGPIS